MKILICESPGIMKYAEADIPKPGKGESLLRIRKVGICGTDIHAYAGNQPFFDYPRILGHEIAADYVEGDAAGFQSGDLVTVIPYLSDGTDIASRLGRPNCATNVQVLGVHRDGAMAEYLVVPSAVIRKAAGLTYDDLVLVEPIAIGAHALSRAALKSGEYTLVIGAGPIGLGIISLANLLGSQVIAMDIDEYRLQQAKNLGAKFLINPNEADVVEKLAAITQGDMPTLVIDATGNQKAINSAFQYMSHGARYVLVGLQKETIQFSHPEFHKRESTLMSSRNALASDFEFVMEKFQERSLLASDFITNRVSFSDAAALFSDPSKPLLKGIKTIIEFD